VSDQFNPYASPTTISLAESSAPQKTRLGRWPLLAVIGLSVCAVVAAGNVVVQLLEIRLYHAVWSGAEYDESYHAQLTAAMRRLGVVAIAAQALTAAAFITWMYRAHRNLENLGWERLSQYSRGAIWMWFVPVLNYIAPYQIMAEIWTKSLPRDLASQRLPLGGHIAKLWWGCWLASGFIAMSTAILEGAYDTNEVYVFSCEVWIASQALRIVAAGLAIVMVAAIERNQAARLHEVAAEAASAIETAQPSPAMSPDIAF
jgi:hypothetical protein